MARCSWSTMGPEARAMVMMVRELGKLALEKKQTRRRRARKAVSVKTNGRPASVTWCSEVLSPLRGHLETTVLPVGLDIEALRYGLACLRRVQSQGAIVDWPIAFVVQRASRAHKEH